MRYPKEKYWKSKEILSHTINITLNSSHMKKVRTALILLGTVLLIGCNQQPIKQAKTIKQLPIEQKIEHPIVKKTSPISEDKPSYLEVKELNLKFKTDSKTGNDIEYKIESDATWSKYVIFTSKELQWREVGCITSVKLEKFSGKPDDNIKNREPKIGDFYKTYNGFYTILNPSLEYCSQDKNIVKLEIRFIQSIKDMSLVD